MKFSQKCVCCFAILLAIFTAQAQNPTNWKADLELYASELEKRHIDLYNKIPKADFKKEVAEIEKRARTQSDFKTCIDLMKLTRRIGDGHTSVSLRNFNLKMYPIEVLFIENEWRVVKTIEKHAKLFKTKLVAIDGISIEKIVGFVGEVAQFVENKYSKINRTQTYLTIAELLHELGLTKSKEKATFRFLDENNRKIEVVLEAVDMNAMTNFVEVAPSIPQIEKPQQPSFDFLWYAPIKETNAVYIRFDSYPSFENMQKFGEELVTYIATNNTKNLVIDLRQNGGGDLYIGVILAYAFNLADSIDWKHGVYILTSRVTFSAGTSNAALLKQLLNGKIVGQPTGSNPSGYQDMDSFELPNSKLVITYSKRHFKLSETVTEGIQPEVNIYPTWKDINNNIDTELTWIVNDLKKRSQE
jgi:hypothetical protein